MQAAKGRSTSSHGGSGAKAEVPEVEAEEREGEMGKISCLFELKSGDYFTG